MKDFFKFWFEAGVLYVSLVVQYVYGWRGEVIENKSCGKGKR